MRNFKTEGIVIKRINVGEADRILTVFTKQNGKIQIRATGVRKITSRRSSHVELLNYSSFSLHQGRSLPILIEAQTIVDHSSIKENLTKVGFAYHLCELIDGLCPFGQEQGTIFELLMRTLDKFSNGDALYETIHEFEIELLSTLGFLHKTKNESMDMNNFIENILERKLRSKKFLSKIL